MYLGRVIGTVVAARKADGLGGGKVLVVAPLGGALEPAGASFLAVDTVQAGPGDLVLVNQEGNGAGQILARSGTPRGVPPGEKRPPIRSLIIGIVDRVDAPG